MIFDSDLRRFKQKVVCYETRGKVQKKNPAGEVTYEYEGVLLNRDEHSITLEALFDRADMPFMDVVFKTGTASLNIIIQIAGITFLPSMTATMEKSKAGIAISACLPCLKMALFPI